MGMDGAEQIEELFEMRTGVDLDERVTAIRVPEVVGEEYHLTECKTLLHHHDTGYLPYHWDANIYRG